MNNTLLEELSWKVEYRDICALAQSLSWKEYQGKVREGVRIFQKRIDKKLYQIDIPNNRDIDDYAFSISRALKTIAKAENEDEIHLIKKLIKHDDISLDYSYENSVSEILNKYRLECERRIEENQRIKKTINKLSVVSIILAALTAVLSLLLVLL